MKIGAGRSARHNGGQRPLIVHADFYADSRLAGCNGLASRPANDANRLAAIVDALIIG